MNTPLSLIASCALLLVPALGQAVDPPATEPSSAPMRVRMQLIDGSSMLGSVKLEFIKLDTLYALMKIPMDRIRSMKVDEDQLVVKINNGDIVSGTYKNDFYVSTIVGDIKIQVDQLVNVDVLGRVGELPLGDGPIAFGGINWSPWRTEFEVQGDKLVSLPKARASFNYGHSGNGRGPCVVSNIGSKEWRDYSVEFDFCMTGVDKAFNKHSLPASHRGAHIKFHVADDQESWNKSGTTAYTFGINDKGEWGLSCYYNHYCRTTVGYSSAKADHTRKLKTGTGLKINTDAGNRIRIDVQGKRIQIWFDEEKIIDMVDEEMNKEFEGRTVNHGGIVIGTSWECMFWIRNFRAREL